MEGVVHCMCLAVVGATAILLYFPSCHFEFAYDDRHAVVENKDVLGETPWEDLLIHDFWGFEIDKFYATKSYRPITIAAWRVLHAWVGSRAPDPFWFHSLNVIAHALASMQTYMLAQKIFALTGHGSSSKTPQWPALLTAALFAAHPVHSEAVAGVVGFAELLCALLGLLALQLLICSDEVLVSPTELLCRSLLGFALIFAASLSKEIGITLCATVVLWDVMVIPLLWTIRSMEEMGVDAVRNRDGDNDMASYQAQCQDSERSAESREIQGIILLRTLAAIALVATYKYGLRHTIARGQDLVTFITKVENPFAYAESRQTAFLSVLLNHADYAALLLWPFGLSADWSYACTDYVYHFTDTRNWRPVVLYTLLLIIVAASRPLAMLRRLLYLGSPSSLVRHERSERLRVRVAFITLAFVVVPFLPASNVFFWVGTAKAERLLYLPSLGFVLLLADLLTADSLEETDGRAGKFSGGSLTVASRATVAAVVIASYCQGTLQRVPHWANQYKLFDEAYKICPNSVKVLENMGIVWMSRDNLEKSEEMFRKAWEMQPDRCDVAYLLGLTYVRQLRLEEGTPLIRQAAENCAVRRDEVVDTLKSMIESEGMGMAGIHSFQATEDQITNMHYMGLARLQDQETGSVIHGCASVETAAWGLLLSKHTSLNMRPSEALAAKVKSRYIPCISFIIATCKERYSEEPGWPAAQCAEGRSTVAQAVGRFGKKSQAVVNATEEYLRTSVGKACFVEFAAISGEELCGTAPSRFDDVSANVELRMHALQTRYVQGRISEAHNLLLQVALKISPMHPLLLQAKAEVLAWSGQLQAAADALETLASALQKQPPPSPLLQNTLTGADVQEVTDEAKRLRSLHELDKSSSAIRSSPDQEAQQATQRAGVDRTEVARKGRRRRKRKATSSAESRKLSGRTAGKGHGQHE